jgi:hypothetical protein
MKRGLNIKFVFYPDKVYEYLCSKTCVYQYFQFWGGECGDAVILPTRCLEVYNFSACY